MASFRTKTGRVVLTDDELRVEATLLTQARRYWEGSKLLFAFVYALTPALLLLYGVEFVREGDWATLLASAGNGIGVLVATRAYYRVYRGFSTDDRIPIDAIERIEVDETWGNPRFVVEYRTDDRDPDDYLGDSDSDDDPGPERRRLLMASRRFAYGGEAFERATRLLRERGIPVEGGAVEGERTALPNPPSRQ
ncbi:hypothetical protein M0R88_14365 [Halorussus gelatinilyticus]|uniref:Uncharacterized protein n=1 Tax=Halorussus gelatinilyticus TaxID=2937524 RepID=A0A8U0IHF5_9EURY|nr:hypothetical protein [Halorussus gelatinilyticus]UPV99691.1 hypothetical protein M0R88_14365 [Halorussus gelatinilyticus]